jgi:hypothetical protein
MRARAIDRDSYVLEHMSATCANGGLCVVGFYGVYVYSCAQLVRSRMCAHILSTDVVVARCQYQFCVNHACATHVVVHIL